MNATSKNGQIFNANYAKQIWQITKLPLIPSFVISIVIFFIFTYFKFFQLYSGVDFEMTYSVGMLFPLFTTIFLGGIVFFKTNNQIDENLLKIKYFLIKYLGILSVFCGYMFWFIIASVEINHISNLDKQTISQGVSKSYFLYFPLIVGSLGFVLSLNQQIMPRGFDSESFALDESIVSPNDFATVVGNITQEKQDKSHDFEITGIEMVPPDGNAQTDEKIFKITISSDASFDQFIEKFGEPKCKLVYNDIEEKEEITCELRRSNENSFVYIINGLPSDFANGFLDVKVSFTGSSSFTIR